MKKITAGKWILSGLLLAAVVSVLICRHRDGHEIQSAAFLSSRDGFLYGMDTRYFPHLHFQCYPKSPPYPPPTPLPTHSHFLALAFPCTGAYKVCLTNGPLFPVMAD